MKTINLLILTAAAAFTCLPSRADAETLHGAYATSPAHPATWVDGASRTKQDLRWDNRRHELVADVKYSTREWADSVHPAEDDDFVLPFPTVHFDPATRTLTANGTTIGKMRDGFWGAEVVLNPDVALSIHRHHGIVHAALIRQDLADY